MEGIKLEGTLKATESCLESASKIRIQKATQAITDQFNKEIDGKLKLIQLVDQNIAKTETFLKKLRYAIIASYYKNDLNAKDGSIMFHQPENGCIDDETYKKSQMHPSFNTDIVGSSSLNQSLIIPRQNVKTHVLKSNNIEINRRVENNQKLFKDFTIVNNKVKFLLAVGNTSKYLNPSLNVNENNQRLFKWVAYVQFKNYSQSIETIVKKVRFRLHPSYKPNDVLETNSPPFQIMQWGWGGFPLCVQIFFHDELKQKPIQLSHNLVLDKSFSGLHTLGAETVFEIWLPAQQILSEYEESSCNRNMADQNKCKLGNVKTEDDSDFSLNTSRLELKVEKIETNEESIFSIASPTKVRTTNSESYTQCGFYDHNIPHVNINKSGNLLKNQNQEPLASDTKRDFLNSEYENSLKNTIARNFIIDKCDGRRPLDQRIEKLFKGCRKSTSLLNRSYYSDIFNRNHQYFHEI